MNINFKMNLRIFYPLAASNDQNLNYDVDSDHIADGIVDPVGGDTVAAAGGLGIDDDLLVDKEDIGDVEGAPGMLVGGEDGVQGNELMELVQKVDKDYETDSEHALDMVGRLLEHSRGTEDFQEKQLDIVIRYDKIK